jgi:hypothetical protein
MNWLKVADIGNSKIVKSMLIWMLITPIFAKLLESANTANITFLQLDKPIVLGLPFSWQVFFFCALSFTIANIIFSYKCPELIKKYKYFADFESRDNSLYLLINYLNQHITKEVVKDNALEIKVIVSKYTPSDDIAKEWASDDTSNVNWKKGIDSLKHSARDNTPDIFSSLRILVAKLYPNWSKACMFLYVLGFFGLTIVMVQNVIYVYNQLQF